MELEILALDVGSVKMPEVAQQSLKSLLLRIHSLTAVGFCF
jgi:hypothetical protein